MFFWIFTVLMLVLALFFLLPPLLSKPKDIEDDRREQNISIAKQQLAELENDYQNGELEEETYKAAKSELEEALYSDLKNADGRLVKTAGDNVPSRLPVLLVALFIPAVAIPMYLKVGNPSAIAESSVTVNQHGESTAASMEKAVEMLAAKLKEQPDNLDGWVMLGRSHMVLNRPADAVKAYEKALSLNADEPVILLQLADALGSSNGGQLTGRPAELINKALQKDPQNVMGLWLAGMASRQQGDNAGAIEYWSKVLGKLNPQSEEYSEVQGLIVEAGGPGPAADAHAAENKPAASGAAAITVTVNLADELKNRAQPNQTVFIYAKAVSGPPMPLAAVRMTVADLPAEVTLDDSKAMMPQMKLSGFTEVTVGARISLSGTPTRSSGDLYTEASPVALGEAINLKIDQLAP